MFQTRIKKNLGKTITDVWPSNSKYDSDIFLC